MSETHTPAPQMVSVYTLPGCMEREVTFDELKRQQRESSRPEPVLSENVRDSFGTTVISEDTSSVRGNPLAAWGSTSEVDSEMMEKPSAKEETKREDQIANEW